jgi:catechol 2,3-dioxygenase-like lactoylglutathione lyase family enzyme
MQPGAFSVSLAVKDLARSRAFYEKLRFTPFAGDGESWQMLRNGPTVLGLFQGMFEKNMLTFNPGWNQDAEPLGQFADVRELRRRAEAQGLTAQAADSTESEAGPASFMLEDPDGNPILIDQHV